MKMKLTTSEKAIRLASALHNFCIRNLKNKCRGCPFAVIHGCVLYGHPCDWEEKIKEAKLFVVDGREKDG
jgi:hypothetical protein